MPTYQITAEGLADLQVNCPGCSGDALVLAMGHQEMQSFQTLRRSDDGRQWWFQVTLKPGGAEDSEDSEDTEDSAVIRLVSVCRIDQP